MSPAAGVESTRSTGAIAHLAHGGHAAEPAVVAREHDACGGVMEVSDEGVLLKWTLGDICEGRGRGGSWCVVGRRQFVCVETSGGGAGDEWWCWR